MAKRNFINLKKMTRIKERTTIVSNPRPKPKIGKLPTKETPKWDKPKHPKGLKPRYMVQAQQLNQWDAAQNT